MSELPPTFEDETDSSVSALRALTGENCLPSAETIKGLRAASPLLLTGQFFAAGKSTFIAALERKGWVNIPSLVTRALRDGEVAGVDKTPCTVADMLADARTGRLLEVEEVRKGVFYATPGFDISDERYVKDLELRGAMRLREIAPDLPMIIPLPPLHLAEGKYGVTEWERRAAEREGYHTRVITDQQYGDLRSRLENILREIIYIRENELADDPRVCFIINDSMEASISTMDAFLEDGQRPNPRMILGYLAKLEAFVSQALAPIIDNSR